MEYYKNLSLEDLPGEIWKDIEGYEGNYQVSNLGRVKSFSFLHKNGKILSQHVIRNYLKVHLSFHQKAKIISTHRLVAKYFVDNSNNLTDVNHKDENKMNNSYLNLEWCTKKYNNNYGTRNERISKSQLNSERKSKRVLQYSLNGDLIKEWESICELGRHGYDRKGISDVCNKEDGHVTCNGFLWKFSSDISVIKPYKNSRLRPVLCYDLNMKFIKCYESISEAAIELNLNAGAITTCCKGRQSRVKCYIFKYK